MSERIGLIIIFVFFSLTGQAQKKLNYPEADKTSYALYQQQKWAELIEFSARARQQGIDFFYLQARTGIAWYNLGKYRKATKWFLKAWEQDQSFDWLQEYLYYSLVWSGRKVEAGKIAQHFSVYLKQKIHFEAMKPLGAAVEIGYAFNPRLEQLKDRPFARQLNIEDQYGEAFFLKNLHFESVDYSHQLAPGFGLNHNFTHIGVSREEQLFWGSENFFSLKINQYQYFLNPWFVLGKKWYVSPSLNLIWGNGDLVLGNINPGTFYNSPYKFSDRIFTTSSWSHFGNFSPGAEVNLANISDTKFTQLSAWLTFYPLSNTHLYFTPRVWLKSASGEQLRYNTIGISGGVQAGPFHFYGQYLNGEMEYFVEPAGYVIANFPGTSKQKFSGSVYFPAGRKYQFVIRYITRDVTETYRVYENGMQRNSADYSYYKHTITAGISWNF